MKKIIVFTIIFILLFNAVYAQSFLWARQFGGTSNEQGYSICTDNNGNVLTTGNFLQTCDFDPGPGTYNLTSQGGTDIFISKLDASGNFIWAKGMGGTGMETGRAIAVDGNGNVYTTGQFVLTVDFDPGPGVFNLTSTGTSMFISKLDPSGNFVWAKSVGDSLNDVGNAIKVDTYGNVYVAGLFQGTVDFDPNAGIYNMTAAGTQDIFILKLDSSGSFIWAKQMGGASFGSEKANSLALDADGNIYTTGIFYTTADFDPGPGIYNLTAAGPVGSSEIFISKLDSSGNFVWAKQFTGSGSDMSYSVAVDGSGNVYTTGQFSGMADFDPGPSSYLLIELGYGDIFVSKLDSAGNFLWARQMGGTASDIGRSIAVDGSGNVYTTGQFSGTADFDPGPGVHNLITDYSNDTFFSELDSSGNFLWAEQIATPNFYDNGNAIAVDVSGSVYATGHFYGTADFDLGPGIYNMTSFGLDDVFVEKLSSEVPTNTITIARPGDNIIAPNPATTQIVMQITDGKIKAVRIFDVLGQLQISNIESQTNSIDISSLPKGIYFIYLEADKGIKAMKFVKQ